MWVFKVFLICLLLNGIDQFFLFVLNLKLVEVLKGGIFFLNCVVVSLCFVLELLWVLIGILRYCVVLFLLSIFFMKKQLIVCDIFLVLSLMSELLDVIWIQDIRREGSLVEDEVVDKFEMSLDKSMIVDEVSLLLF